MSTAITKRTPIVPTTWEEVTAAAKYIFASGLCPEHIKTPEQAAIVILSGTELGVGVMVSLREIFPIEKNIGMSTKLMIALVKQHGGDIKILEATTTQATTQVTLPSGKTCPPVTLTMAQAQKANYHRYWQKAKDGEPAGWKDKPSWIQQPDLMLAYRSASRNIRANMPNAIMNMPTVDEARDFAPNGETIIEGIAHVMDSEPEQPKPETRPAPPAPAPQPAPQSTAGPAPQASESPKVKQPAPSGNGQQGAAWTADQRKVAAFHAWLTEACQHAAVNLTYDTIKQKALHVEHLKDFTGKFDEAQRAVLALIADILKQAGNPTQATLETAK